MHLSQGTGGSPLDLRQEPLLIIEADACRQSVLPNLHAVGWIDELIPEKKNFMDSRIPVSGRQGRQKRVDYLFRSRRDYHTAIVEARSTYLSPGQGLQQFVDYNVMRDLHFGYSTNGKGIVKHNLRIGIKCGLEAFPSHKEAGIPFDRRCSLALGAFPLTRQRAAGDRKQATNVYAQYGGRAVIVFDQLLDLYAEHGIDELTGAVMFKVLPATRHTNLTEVGRVFGGVNQLRKGIDGRPSVIYAQWLNRQRNSEPHDIYAASRQVNP